LNGLDRPWQNELRLEFDRPAAALAQELRGAVSRISGTFGDSEKGAEEVR